MPFNPMHTDIQPPAALHAATAGGDPLVDADPGQELARLQALQARQQRGRPALSLAIQAPQTILSLFK